MGYDDGRQPTYHLIPDGRGYVWLVIGMRDDCTTFSKRYGTIVFFFLKKITYGFFLLVQIFNEV